MSTARDIGADAGMTSCKGAKQTDDGERSGTIEG